ncbi:MAG: fructose-1,6-bisphosphatase, partial [Lachnospiraceae bacterium]|nr:fructose-1,6-bisphosphatase [Lachnospiraceae bacterium]
PSIAKASTEIINLSARLSLPKGTEHFITDIHGEYEALSHVLKNGSGAVRKKVTEVFGKTLSEADIRELSTLIYYPKEKIELECSNKTEEQMNDWYRIMLYRLIAVCRYTSSKYTRQNMRERLPEDFAFVIEELITEKDDIEDKEAYYEEIINTIIRIRRADVFITALAELIPGLAVDHLHILGDIYDRGSGPDDIMDKLMQYHSLDIQWGNHDIVWMGAAAGQLCCIANVVRVSARYGNLDTLEDGYGINLLPLATFALRTYGNDPCELFRTKNAEDLSVEENGLNMRIHKAISVIQFKLQGQLAKKRPEFEMDDRAVMEAIDYQNGTIALDGKVYPLLDTNFPTVDPEDPNRLTEEEEQVMQRLRSAFMGCERLQTHVQFLLKNGSLYKVYNGNLLYHGCMPLDENGDFQEVSVYGRTLKGRALYDRLDTLVRRAFFSTDPVVREMGKDILWWIWCSKYSPLFGKDKMATFERYFIAEKETHEEHKNPYYELMDDEKVVDSILAEFGLTEPFCHIINGHVPVKKGKSPVHCGGKLLVIDGGFSKAYQGQTGIAGYTLIYNSHGVRLVAHKPFTSMEDAIQQGTDILSDNVMVAQFPKRRLIADTDAGKEIMERIAEIEELLDAYRSGVIREKNSR